jgi:hypothetical protein
MARFAIEHEFGRRPVARSGGPAATLRVHPSLPGVARGNADTARSFEAGVPELAGPEISG